MQDFRDCRLGNRIFVALNKSDFRIDRAGTVFDDMGLVLHKLDATAKSSMSCRQFVDYCIFPVLLELFFLILGTFSPAEAYHQQCPTRRAAGHLALGDPIQG